jgi:hypothetical protein
VRQLSKRQEGKERKNQLVIEKNKPLKTEAEKEKQGMAAGKATVDA